MDRADIPAALLKIAAKRSTETQFGWAHPDCEALSEAARIIRGDPPETPLKIPEVVLSAQTPTP